MADLHKQKAVHKKVQLQTSRPMQLPFRPEGDNVLLLGLNGPAQQVSSIEDMLQHVRKHGIAAQAYLYV